MDQHEAEQRLEAIAIVIREFNQTEKSMDLPVWANRFLQNILSMTEPRDDKQLEIQEIIKPIKEVIISCDASIKKNPGGLASIGIVIEYKDEETLAFAKESRATTCNQAEYDAIYEGLTTLMSLKNNPACKVEIRSDSRLAIEQLNGRWECTEPKLQRRKDCILELVKQLPVPVTFKWLPRNSTKSLEKANYLAQDFLGVPRH